MPPATRARPSEMSSELALGPGDLAVGIEVSALLVAPPHHLAAPALQVGVVGTRALAAHRVAAARERHRRALADRLPELEQVEADADADVIGLEGLADER